VGAVAVGWVFALAAAAESEGLTRFCIDFEGRGLPAHGFIIEQSLEKESANCGRWKARGRILPILLIPIEKDTRGGVEIELVALLERAPEVLVGLGIQGHLSFCGMGNVVQEDEVSRFVELL